MTKVRSNTTRFNTQHVSILTTLDN